MSLVTIGGGGVDDVLWSWWGGLGWGGEGRDVGVGVELVGGGASGRGVVGSWKVLGRGKVL